MTDTVVVPDCTTCRWGLIEPGPQGQIDFNRRVCRATPPQVVTVQTPQGPVHATAFPQVGRGIWCSLYAPKHPTEETEQ